MRKREMGDEDENDVADTSLMARIASDRLRGSKE